MPIDSLNRFERYSLTHWLILAVIIAVAVAVAMYRRRIRRMQIARADVVDVQVSAVILVIWIIEQSFEFLPSRFKLSESLPVHFCDIVGLVAAFAVRSHSRLLRSILYYWGFVLSPTALIYPDLEGGPTTLQFWVFWVPHCMIIAAATYDLIGRRFRPSCIDFLLGVLSILVYLAVIIPFDILINENYGYVSPKDGGPLDFLGTWPARLFKASVGVLASLALVTVPWWLERVYGRRRESLSELSGEPHAGTSG